MYNTLIDMAQESDTSPANQSFIISEAEWADIKALLDKRYAEIATLLRYNKTKDESIQRLSAEVQKYREGFAFSALKPCINAIIAMREDCRKSLRDAKMYVLDDDKTKKYIEYLVSSIEEMLSNIGLERTENLISINGKPLSGLATPKAQPTKSLTSEQENDDCPQVFINDEPINDVAALIEYLSKNESAIRLALQDRAVVDKTIKEYTALAARTDAEYYLALIAPIARQLYALYDCISSKSHSAGDFPGDALQNLYDSLLEKVVDKTGEILSGAGIFIETIDTGVFDTQKHKLIKTIPTEDEKLDRFVKYAYTDCYTYDGKVIYHSKVDVYKYNQVQELTTKGEQTWERKSALT